MQDLKSPKLIFGNPAPEDILAVIDDLDTPAFVYDSERIQDLMKYAVDVRAKAQCGVLFAVKSFSIADGLEKMAPRLDGFAVSSLFEARLVAETTRSPLHLTTPGLRHNDLHDVASVCDYISFNSLSQWQRYSKFLNSRNVSCGLRVNPQLPFVSDPRYDPCRVHSKLGVPLDELAAIVCADPNVMPALRGLLFHSNCDSVDFSELLATVEHLESRLGSLLQRIEWINLGGGYLFEESPDIAPLVEAIDHLRSKYGLHVFIEPGAALVRAAGYIVSTVLDMFNSSNARIAVLDTTVNHMPEVFEYEFEPDVVGHDDRAPNEYTLAGCTCLAGDIFGKYRFQEPLQIGSKVIFSNAGAYTLTKAHMFNGVNLPTVYELQMDRTLRLSRRFTFEDFASRWEYRASVPV